MPAALVKQRRQWRQTHASCRPLSPALFFGPRRFPSSPWTSFQTKKHFPFWGPTQAVLKADLPAFLLGCFKLCSLCFIQRSRSVERTLYKSWGRQSTFHFCLNESVRYLMMTSSVEVIHLHRFTWMLKSNVLPLHLVAVVKKVLKITKLWPST